ncbi:MAG: guanylate kinase [Gammaproteobacteria bacterium]|nr:guanylate kinase [Gammaproteobacteria bacterium]|tara:strand:+ start:42057 stop:42680 length:624 start_codon:yes stop_codon:yes gene_type:complete
MNYNISKNFNNVYIISAPSGAGKTSLVKQLCNDWHFIKPSISHTTRKRRLGEKNGEDYFFVAKKEFIRQASENFFLEHQKVYGNFYGTSLKSINSIIDSGCDVILEINYEGMLEVKKIISDAITIYILPPDIETLENRLVNRGDDKNEVLKRRVHSSKKELNYAQFADYTIINDEFDIALWDLKRIILKEKMCSNYLEKWISSIVPK